LNNITFLLSYPIPSVDIAEPHHCCSGFGKKLCGPGKIGEPSSKAYETAWQNDSDLVFTRVTAKVKI
jgi:hypothetical protein